MKTTLHDLATTLKRKTGTAGHTKEILNSLDHILKLPAALESRARLRNNEEDQVYRLSTEPQETDFHATSRERRLEASLWHEFVPSKRFLLGDIHVVSFQVPLYARRSKGGLGAIDLLGCDLSGCPVAIEVKIANLQTTKSGKPRLGFEPLLRPIIESAVYLSALRSHWQDFSREWRLRTDFELAAAPKTLRAVVLAPDEYWSGICECRHCVPSLPLLNELVHRLRAFGISVQLASVVASDVSGIGRWQLGQIRERKLPDLR